jgi:hypothetical protein
MPLWMPDNDAKALVDSGVASADGLTARQSDESIMLMVNEAQCKTETKRLYNFHRDTGGNIQALREQLAAGRTKGVI